MGDFSQADTVILTIIGLMFSAYSLIAGFALRSSLKVSGQLSDLLARDHVHREEFERQVALNRTEIAKVYGAVEIAANRIAKLEVYVEILRNNGGSVKI